MSNWLDASEIATDLGVSIDRLRGMARRGSFPEMLRVDRGVYRVRKLAYEAWERSRMTGAVTMATVTAVEVADQAAGHRGRRGSRRRAHGSSATSGGGSCAP